MKLQPPSHNTHTASLLLQVERQITNQTYILRLHVTTQMAQLLFPPRGELEAAHQVRAGWLGRGWWNGSTLRNAFEPGRGLACHALSTGHTRLLQPHLLPAAPCPCQAAVALDPQPPHASRLGGSSTYTQLFKQRLTIIDESDRAWPVQVRGGAVAGRQRQGP